MAFQPKINLWNGEASIELYLKDFRLPPEEARQRLFLEKLRLPSRFKQTAAWRRERLSPAPYRGPFPVRSLTGAAEKTRAPCSENLVCKPGAALLYAAVPRYAAALAERLAESPYVSGAGGAVSPADGCRGLLAPEGDAGARGTQFSSAAEPWDRELEHLFARLILYQLPITPVGFRRAWSFRGGELYLAYTDKDLERNRILWSRLYPGREQLVQLLPGAGT